MSTPSRLATAGGHPGNVVDDELEAFSASLADIHERVSVAHSSLASKLAQHNGLKQFGADFSDRAPPLELRVLLPELEAAIEQLLDSLRALGTRLRLLAAPGAGRHAELRGALLQRVADVRQESLATFDAQRNKVRELAAASPLLSPMIAPGLGRRLASAMSSPQHSYVEPSKGWSPSTLSTGWSPSTLSTMSHTPGKTPPVVTPTLGIYEMEMMNELEDFVLEELSEDESEFDGDVPPFSSVFAAQGSCGKPP